MKKPLLIILASVIFLAGASIKINKDFSGLEQSLAQAEQMISPEAEERLKMFRDGVSTALEEPKKDIYSENGTSKEEIKEILAMSKYNRNPKFKFNQIGFKIDYSPKEDPVSFAGEASYYLRGKDLTKTATGAQFRDDLPTIAINPGAGIQIPALVKLTNLDEKSPGYGTSTIAVANDFGPFNVQKDSEGRIISVSPHRRRIVDMSRETRNRLGFEPLEGIYKIRVEVIESYYLGKE